MVAQHLFFEVDTAVEHTHTEVLEFGRKSSRLEQAAVIECEIADLANSRRNSDIHQILAVIESGSRDSGYGRRDSHRLQVLAICKSTLGNQTNRDLVLEDVFRRQRVIGRNQTVIEDQCSFLPFVLVGIDAASGEDLLAYGSDGKRNDHFLQVLAISERLMVNACQPVRQIHTGDHFIALKSAGSYQTRADGYYKTRFDRLVRSNKDAV